LEDWLTRDRFSWLPSIDLRKVKKARWQRTLHGFFLRLTLLEQAAKMLAGLKSPRSTVAIGSKP
jgi:hypothetical protein